MWLNLITSGLKVGAKVIENRRESKMLESQAQRLHYEKMARGEIEYKEKVIASNDKGIKDEIVLILVSIPFLVLVYSVFSDDPSVKDKVDLFFQYFDQLPLWYQALFIGICSAIYGLKGADIFKRK